MRDGIYKRNWNFPIMQPKTQTDKLTVENLRNNKNSFPAFLSMYGSNAMQWLFEFK